MTVYKSSDLPHLDEDYVISGYQVKPLPSKLTSQEHVSSFGGMEGVPENISCRVRACTCRQRIAKERRLEGTGSTARPLRLKKNCK